MNGPGKTRAFYTAAVLALALALLFLPGCPKTGSEVEAAAPAMAEPSVPVQAPSDPDALSEKMTRMKTDADRVIAETAAEYKKGGDAEELFKKGTAGIMEVMRPEFGPANAWLFNERAAKLEELCDALDLDPSRCQELESEAMEDR